MVHLRPVCLAATLSLLWLTGTSAADMEAPAPIPVPQQRPDSAAAPPPVPEAKPPVPEQRPKVGPEPEAGPETPADKQPADNDEPAVPKTDAGSGAPPASEAPPPPISEDPQAYKACLSQIRQAGVEFTEVPAIDDGHGCGIEKPIKVRTVLAGIRLEPEATLRCETALALSRWAKGSVLPSADIAFGTTRRIAAFNQATSYACRNRNSAETGKLSEHAHGNAIDIAGFSLSDGTTITIAPRQKDATLQGAFERAIMATACLFFTTVLGPGSDAAHETHLHLDVLQRKGGYRYCW